MHPVKDIVYEEFLCHLVIYDYAAPKFVCVVFNLLKCASTIYIKLALKK